MISLNRFTIDKHKLMALDREEQALLILSGHALNLLGIWINLANLSAHHQSPSALEDKLCAARTHIILRTLYGSLAETWEWLKRPASQQLIGQKYLDRMPEEARLAWAELKRSFGSSGMLHALRNNFAFHYPKSDQIEAAVKGVPDAEDWSWYAAKENTNSFYLSCELVIGYGALGMADKPTDLENLNHVLQVAIKVVNDLNTFLGCLMATSMRAHFPEVQPGEHIRVHGAPAAASFTLPFFLDEELVPA
jgi:hypothetical protein